MDAGRRVVILGAGQAGAQAAFSLRQGGFAGEIALVGDEPAPPYQRPPLSKAYLKGQLPEERLYFKPAEVYAGDRIELVLGDAATAIDRSARTVTLASGRRLGWDVLILATGSRPRLPRIPGADLKGVHVMRTLADVEAIREDLKPGAKLLVVGAGYIGLETAAAAKSLGVDIEVIEAAPRSLMRVTSPFLSDFFERYHAGKGVAVRTATLLDAFVGKGGRVTGAQFRTGETTACDAVVLGVGIMPNQEIAAAAGVACDDGVLVDLDARTNDPRVFAIGDCARRPLVHFGRMGRLESVHNAIEQGKIAAAAILGLPRPKEDAPWFWSDQYDLKLQIAGLFQGADEIVVRGDPETARFAVYAFAHGRLIAVDAVNSPPDFLAMKAVIASGRTIAPDAVRDTSIPVKDLAAKAR